MTEEMNDLSEEWTRWVPMQGLPSKMYLERLIDDRDGMSLLLTNKDESCILSVLFDGLVLSYRNTDEGRRLKTINFLDEKYGADFYTKWSLFKVVDSSYSQWFKQETYSIYSGYNIEHYVFLTCDDVVEVLSTFEPQVSISKNEQKTP